MTIEKYQKLLNLDKDIRFTRIDHDDAMVAEVYFLNHFAKQIQVPAVIKSLPPSQESHGINHTNLIEISLTIFSRKQYERIQEKYHLNLRQ